MSRDPETRVTSETGGQKGEKLPKLGGADADAMLELARVYGFGEGKYDRFNYLKGYPWSLSIDALYRHLLAFQGGEDNDQESNLNHMAHVAWHALALVAFSKRKLGTDDRFKGIERSKPPFQKGVNQGCSWIPCHNADQMLPNDKFNECAHHLAEEE